MENLHELKLEKKSPYQGKRAVEYHIALLQSTFSFDEKGPVLIARSPNTVKPFTSSDMLSTKELLLHNIVIKVPVPETPFKILGFTLPLSKKVYFTTDKEYPSPEKCYFCNSKKSKYTLVALKFGAAWTCGCNMHIHKRHHLDKIIDVLDWWENELWWSTLFDKYIKKDKPSPFCNVHIFIFMAYRLISLDGFHRADSGQSTREKLRAFWRADPTDPIYPDEALLNMSKDALHAERWPDSVTLSKKIIETGLASKNIAWKEKIQQATSSDFIDVRDPLITGILAALPAYFQIEEKKKIRGLPEGKESTPFGKEKQRGVLKLMLISQQTLNMRKYPTVRFVFINEHHQIFRWDASQDSAPELNNKQWYLLQGTIRRHSLSNNGYVTHIYHCKDIRPCDQETPQPPFIPISLTTIKRDEVTVSYSLNDVDGRIDGRTYVKIERIWLEEGRQHDLTVFSSWPLQNIEKELLNLITSKGLHRNTFNLDPLKDKSLINALKCVPEQPHISQYLEGYWVDDAYADPTETHLRETARAGASQTEQILRKPHWFSEHASAQQHGRKLMMGRVIHARFKYPEFALCDFSIRGHPSYIDFVKAARARGINFLINLPESNMTPLSLMGASILSETPVHANWPEQAHYTLKGKNFLILPHLTQYSPYLGRSILQPHPAGLSSAYPVLSVRDAMLPLRDQMQPGWLYLNVNETTLYYLRKLGCRCLVAFNEKVEYSTGLSLDSELPKSEPAYIHKDWEEWLKNTLDKIEENRNTIHQPSHTHKALPFL